MKSFSLIVFLLFAVEANALPLDLLWDKVTTNTDGSALSEPVRYRLYRQVGTQSFQLVHETVLTRWTWLVPSIGRSTYRVTAINKDGESGPSNELKIIVERAPREDK